MVRRVTGSGRLERRTRAGWLMLVGLLALSAVETRADDPGPTAARWVSEEAIAYVEILRPEALIDRATSPKVRERLKAIPSLEERLKKKEVRELQGVAKFVAAALGTTVDAGLRDLTGGGIVLAVEGKEKPERILLILKPRDRALLQRTHDALIELARADAENKGQPDPLKPVEHRGVTGYQLSPQGAYAILDGSLVVANDADALKAVIDRAKGNDPFRSIAESDDWKGRRSALDDDAVAFGFARLDALRKLDPKQFGGEKPNAGAVLLLGPWYESLRRAPWIAASVSLAADRLAAELVLPPPAEGREEAYKTFLPGAGEGATPLIQPEGTILSVSLWRDLSAVWEVRDRLLPPEALQGLAQLDSFAGQFFGGRDFGTGVLGAIRSDWRLVIANQDYEAMDPRPDKKLPGFALIVSLDPDDQEFAVRLQAAFQSFIGLVNLGAAQQKAPPLMLGSESFQGVTISKAAYLPVKKSAKADAGSAKGPENVDNRFNFLPSAAVVDHTFLLSTNVALARSLIKAIQEPRNTGPTDATLIAEADGPELAKLVEVNRETLAIRNMLSKGRARADAESRIDLLARLLRDLGHGRLSVQDRPEASRLTIEFQLGKP